MRISNEAAIALACKLLSYLWGVVRIRSFRLMKTDWRRNIALALASLLGALPGALSATDAGLRLSAPTWMGNRIRFTLNCESGVTYVIERSPDLQSWTPVLTNNGPSIRVLMAATAPGGMGFYRARRGPPAFIAALVVEEGFDASGSNLGSDSFDSALGPYNPGSHSTNGDIVTLTTNANSITIGNAKVTGTVRTPPGGIQGVTATIGSGGAVGDSTWVSGSTGFQSGHFQPTFTLAHFPDAVLPTIGVWYTPLSGTAPDGLIYDRLLTSGNYHVTDLSGSVYVGQTNTVLWVDGSINISGGGGGAGYAEPQIHIAPGASLAIYMAGATTTISGNGLVNDTAQAKTFAYYGLPSNHTINLTGNGAFYGTIYAPEADFYLIGSGSSADDFTGASVTKTTTMTGNFNFHYDENLARTGPFR